MIGYIYKTTNLINQKIYIGKRKLSYFSHYYKGSGAILKQAFAKYGRENFSCELIDAAETIEELNKKEFFWIKYYNSQDPAIGYNIVDGGAGSVGYHHSEEAKAKMSKAKKGKLLTDEWRKNISINSSRWNTGKHLSDETKQKISSKLLGRTPSNETIEKIKQTFEQKRGTPDWEEWRKKLRESRARVLADGTWSISEQGMKRLRESGSRPKSEEHRKHLSENRIISGIAKGAKNPKAKKVYCFETDTIYSWAGEAAEKLNVSVQGVRMCCQGVLKSIKGYHLKYYDRD